ncbi:MAG: TolC family protein [Rikenellaceae bacterium]|jgi:outer membrane protein|nr:TolC family protein [Rikenellaceae bacterium]
MNKLVLTIAATAAVCVAGAQQKWTLRQCIDYAIENNVSIRQTALEVERAEIDLNTTQNSRLPSLSGGVGQNFSFGRTSVDIGGDTPEYRNTQTSNTSLSLSVGMPVFQGFRINNQVKAGRIDLQASAEGLEKAKQNLGLNIAGYYLDVLFKKEILAVYREQLALTREQVVNTAALVNEGKVARSQLYEIEAQLAQNEVSEVTAANDLALSLLDLRQALNLGQGTEFDVTEIDLADFTPAGALALSSPDEIYDIAVGMRPAVREAELRLQSSEVSVKIARSAYLPSLNFSANANAGYMYMFGQDFAQASLADQIRNRHSESVGLNLSIPIFNRNSTRNNVRSARIGVANQTLALEGVKQALYKEIQQAYQRAVAAEARYESSTKALVASREAFRAMELRYEGGKATVYEYSDAHTKLISSQSDQTQAKYDFVFSTKILDFYRGLPLAM